MPDIIDNIRLPDERATVRVTLSPEERLRRGELTEGARLEVARLEEEAKEAEEGERGGPEPRCTAVHLEPHPCTGSKVILTCAHLDRVPENLNENNLMAMCQACHLAYDRDQHTATRAGRSGT